jgi:hypothetical protein
MAKTLAIQTTAATAAARMCLAAGGRPVIDNSSRTHAGHGVRQRARGAIVGGASHTCNLWAGAHFGVPVVEAANLHAAFPNVRGAVITADDLDVVDVERLMRDGAPVTACAFGASVADVALEVERWQQQPASTEAGPGQAEACPVELYRYPASNGDVVQPRREPPVLFARPLLELVMASGRRTSRLTTVADARDRCAEALAVLPAEVRDLDDPEPVRVSWSERVWRTRVHPGSAASDRR